MSTKFDATGVQVRVLETLAQVSPAQWNPLFGNHLLVRHEYLHALEVHRCACADTGWTPQHLTLWRADELVAAMPLYLKHHSYGEYVFDWAWANAYHQHNEHYYPKLLCAVPFTPVSGPRLGAADAQLRDMLLRQALQLAQQSSASSLHLLFPTADDLSACGEAKLMQRRAVQFHWRNQGYATFDDFLAHMTHEKRKKIKQERRKLRELGIEVQRIDGSAMQEWHWLFFFDCYRRTYRLHHSQPYLNLAFFLDLGTKLAQHVVLILATHQGRPVAAALDLSDGQRLYGRYWGSVEFVPGLHFELCYYQGIDFCIERGLQVFEGGAQGEHKLARGLLPVTTHSAHWIAHPGFAKAIGEFLRREGAGVGHYVSELEESAPFRQANPSV